MRDHISWLLWAWAAASPLLFRALPGRDATIICLVAGWAFLPVAPYPGDDVPAATEASACHALAIPTAMQLNKGTAIGLGCLAGLVLFDRRAFGRLRFGLPDLPIAVWCLVPMASCPANGLPLSESLTQVRYLGLTWGVPYLMGRAYLVDPESQARFAVGLSAGGLAYLPICLVEWVAGPSAYRLLYGPHPYEFEGAVRAIGNRPLGFLEHGNQLGIWMATAAVASTWLWVSGASKRPGGTPAGWLAAALIAGTLLCQSHASIVLMALALLPLAIFRLSRRGKSWVSIITWGIGATALVMTLLAARRGFRLGSLRADVANFFRGINKSSFTWRLARSEDFLPVALRKPILGWGRADWRPDGLRFVNPVNLPLWLLGLGMYGLLGLSALLVAWATPIVRSLRRRHHSLMGPAGGATGAMIAVAAISCLDSFSNSTVILPVLAALGGLNRPSVPDPGHG